MSVTDPTDPSSRRGPPPGWTGPRTTTPSRSSTPTASRSCRFSVTHDAAGLRTLVQRLLAAGVAEVGIERPDGPVVDALRQAGLTVLRHPTRPAQEPAQPLRLGREQGRPVRRLRAGRRRAHRPAPAAPTAGRHPGHHRAAPDRARPPGPGRPPGRGGQPAARAPADLLPRRGRAVRRHRLRHQPAVPGPLPHPGPRRLALAQAAGGLAVLGRLQRPHPARHPAHPAARRPGGATGPAADTAAAVTAAFVAVAAHPHHPDRGPGRPDRRATRPAPRQRRSSPACPAPGACAPPGCSPRSATPAAGSPPPTRWPAWPGSPPPPASPARSSVVCFRWGADKQLRDAVCDFAGDSRHANPWAADLYHRARDRGHDHPHAVRILARAWVDIIWACWTTNTPYDPDRHGALQRILNQDQPAAA